MELNSQTIKGVNYNNNIKRYYLYSNYCRAFAAPKNPILKYLQNNSRFVMLTVQISQKHPIYRKAFKKNKNEDLTNCGFRSSYVTLSVCASLFKLDFHFPANTLKDEVTSHLDFLALTETGLSNFIFVCPLVPQRHKL